MPELSADCTLLLLGILGHDATKCLHFDLPLQRMQARGVSVPSVPSVTDFHAILEVKDTKASPPFEQTITITVDEIKLKFEHTGTFDFVNPDKGNPVNLLHNMKRNGIFYTRGTSVVKPGPTHFTAQQFPRYGGQDAGNDGRVVLYTYTTDGITGVFVSEDDNYVVGIASNKDTTSWKVIA
ncbi:uncharacterized protein FIBRA_09027 [Fibroporia radiculosa]|uniref:Uncharacterized protein n=1 Tax=Fibroporia radiculosa TaxID=599839 RepID=J4GIQ6_9APHY|nr:uncharacterized protein FIBRA_09027 [Fibroporia radiculosa]CCM06733.1 predicted protein [Fibroporia radiculosa]